MQSRHIEALERRQLLSVAPALAAQATATDAPGAFITAQQTTVALPDITGNYGGSVIFFKRAAVQDPFGLPGQTVTRTVHHRVHAVLRLNTQTDQGILNGSLSVAGTGDFAVSGSITSGAVMLIVHGLPGAGALVGRVVTNSLSLRGDLFIRLGVEDVRGRFIFHHNQPATTITPLPVATAFSPVVTADRTLAGRFSGSTLFQNVNLGLEQTRVGVQRAHTVLRIDSHLSSGVVAGTMTLRGIGTQTFFGTENNGVLFGVFSGTDVAGSFALRIEDGNNVLRSRLFIRVGDQNADAIVRLRRAVPPVEELPVIGPIITPFPTSPVLPIGVPVPPFLGSPLRPGPIFPPGLLSPLPGITPGISQLLRPAASLDASLFATTAPITTITPGFPGTEFVVTPLPSVVTPLPSVATLLPLTPTLPDMIATPLTTVRGFPERTAVFNTTGVIV